MAAQLNYNYGTPKGVPGGKFDIAFDEVVTRKNENEDGVMKYGLAVAIGADAGNGIKVPVTGTTASQIDGITIALPNTEQDMAGKVVVKKNAARAMEARLSTLTSVLHSATHLMTVLLSSYFNLRR